MEVCPGAPQLYAAVHHPDDEHLSSSVYSDVSDSSESHGDSQHEAKARRLSGAFTPRRVEAVAELADAQWSAAESSALYNVEGWGAPYFSVNESGRILVTPMAGGCDRCGGPPFFAALRRLDLHSTLPTRQLPACPLALFVPPSCCRGRPRHRPLRPHGAGGGPGPASAAALPLPAHRRPPHRQAQRARPRPLLLLHQPRAARAVACASCRPSQAGGGGCCVAATANRRRRPPRAWLVVQAAFRAAIERFEYAGVYAGVFPVKCNHDKDLIQAVVDYGGWMLLGGGGAGWVYWVGGGGRG